MNVGILGMQMTQNEFSAIGMRQIWSEENRIAKICDVEVAIAKAEAEYDYIPKDKAAIIEEYVNLEHVDLRKLRLSYGKAGHFVSGLVKYFEKVLPDGAGDYLHYGATTQDILDTGMVLQLKEAHEDTKQRLTKLIKVLAKLAREHEDVVGAGRAHGNHAIPINYGYKFGIYLNEFMSLYQRLSAVEDDVFTSAVSGSVGSYAGYGENALDVAEKIAEILDLNFDPIGWHTQRERFVEYTHILAMISGAMGKMAKNLVDLSRSELKEYDESYGKGRQGSTAMPTMHNPYLTEAVHSLANMVHNEMNLMYQSMIVSHEKDIISMRSQWVAIPEINMYVSGQLSYLIPALQEGTFIKENIQKNLYLEGGMILSERLMMELSHKIGKAQAHELIYTLGNESREEGQTFEAKIRGNEVIQEYLSAEELDTLFDPTTYTGKSKQLLEIVLRKFDQFEF